MRSHGVPSFPDPTGGKLLIKATPGSGLNPNSPAFQSASQACKKLQPSGLGAPAVNSHLKAQALKFVNCLRSHGVPSFPDPTFSGGMFALHLPAGTDPNSPQFQSAQRACQSLSPIGGAP